MKKYMFLLMFLCLVTLANGINIDAQNFTTCLNGYCETRVDLSKYLTGPDLTTAKSTNYSNKLPSITAKLKTINYKWAGDFLVIYGTVGDNTYWTMNVSSLNIDPWWNRTNNYYTWNSNYPTTTAANTFDIGKRIHMNATKLLIEVNKTAGTTGLFLTVYGVNNATTLIGNYTFSGVQAVINPPLTLYNTWDYWILIGSGVGVSYTETYKTLSGGYPAKALYFNATGMSFWDGTMHDNGDTINFYNIANITMADSLSTYYTTNLYLNGTENNVSVSTGTLNITGTTNLTGLYVTLYKNGTMLNNTTTTSMNLSTMTSGFWNITAFFSNSSTNSTTTYWATIGSINGTSINLLLNGTATNKTITWPSFINETAIINTTGVNVSILRNGTLLGTGTSNFTNIEGLGGGYYNITANYSGNDSFGASSSTLWVNVTKCVPSTSITSNISNPVTQGQIVSLTCNPAGATFYSFYNDSLVNFTTGNVFTLNTTGLLGNYNYTCDVIPNENCSSVNASYVLNVALPGGLTIYAWDEDNTSKSLVFNVAIYNTSFSTTSLNQTVYSNNSIAGSLTVTVSVSGYGSRRYYIDVAPPSAYTLNTYLVNNSIGQDTSTYTFDVLQNPISSSKINMIRLYGSNKTIVGQGLTDDTGKFLFFLNPTVDYLINITASGYSNKSLSLIPTDTTYTFYLYRSLGEVPPYLEYLNKLTANCYNTSTNWTCSWADSSGHLIGTWLNVTEMTPLTTNLICSNYSANATGTLVCQFPAIYQNKSYIVNLYSKFESLPTSILAFSKIWSFFTPSTLGVLGILLAFLLVMTSGYIGFSISPSTGVLMTLISVVFMFLINFISMGNDTLTILAGFVISGGILLVKIEKQ